MLPAAFQAARQAAVQQQEAAKAKAEAETAPTPGRSAHAHARGSAREGARRTLN